MDEVLKLPVIDGHCHPFDPAKPAGTVIFEEPVRGAAGETLLQRAVRNRLADAERAGLLPHASAERVNLLHQAQIVGQVVDFGWPDQPLGPAAYANAVGVPVKPLCRLEAICDAALAETGDVREAALRVAAAVTDALASGGWAGFKCVAAYETGLDIAPVPADVAQAEHDLGIPRSRSKPLNDYLLLSALRQVADCGGIVQFHTGIGAHFLPLTHESPWSLLGLLEQEWMANARVVIVHAGFPHVTAAGRLAALFGNVYCDTSILLPYSFPAHHGYLKELLAFAPASRVMFGSDGCFGPERYWIAAVLGKEALAQLCDELVRDRYLCLDEALSVARAVLHDTADQLYGFGGGH